MIFVSHPAYYIPIENETSYHKMPMIMMFFFKDHVNIFAKGNENWKEELKNYQLTKKNTLQIYYDKPLNETILLQVFMDSFGEH